ncbi:hypothetical protein DM02DRAFT_694167 [Periconia macrospinosa]|uniref:Mid2 domain-containing protein n=1 Tax=Periconia macrospinosa TaxID=97972 RepID=A0A2V1D7L8_9PLEO|nr:hypothetical protein DM02DRAFT_694167 [Periconia macrospinosa]
MLKLIALVLTLWTLSAKSQSCYFPNGNPVPTSTSAMLLSRDDAIKTICCALKRQNPFGGNVSEGQTQDRCLSNGLCHNAFVEDGEFHTEYWATTCTDTNITSGKCLNVCNESGQRDINGASRMTPCEGSDTRWCCGTSNTCCISGIGVVELPLNFSVKSAPIASSKFMPPPLSEPTSSTLPKKPEASTPSLMDPHSSSAPFIQTGVSPGIAAAIGISTGVGVMLLVGSLVLIWRKVTWKRKDVGKLDMQNVKSVFSYYHTYKGGPVELPYEVQPLELGTPVFTELPESALK